jgi:MFS family permease
VGLSLAPLALAVTADVITKERQAYAQRLIGGPLAIGTSAGYVLGSLVTEESGWRFGFITVLSVIRLPYFLASPAIEAAKNPAKR